MTWTVNENVPLVVGFPERTPPVDNRSPGGRVPSDTVHVKGVCPPDATKVREYVFLTDPEGNDVVVMVTGVATTIE